MSQDQRPGIWEFIRRDGRLIVVPTEHPESYGFTVDLYVYDSHISQVERIRGVDVVEYLVGCFE